MRRTLQALLVVSLLMLCVGVAHAGIPPVDWDSVDPSQVVPGELIVLFRDWPRQRDDAAAAMRAKVHARVGGAVLNRFRTISGARVKVPFGMTLKDAAQRYLSDPNVRRVEPNYILHASRVPNDPRFDELWGMERIRATNAWDLGTGSSNMVVAVIDTGILRTHEDLADNIWHNPFEDWTTNGLPGTNGLDDDNNGYIDDNYGWDFYANDNDPTDETGHGTHVSGTIGAVGSNALGVAGVNWHVKLVSLRFLGGSPATGSTADAVLAIEYAANTNFNIRLSNNSWGGGGYSLALAEAIQHAEESGQLFVAAAGNSGLDNDTYPHYPSSYDNENIISVAAIASDGSKSGFSNYGKESVDIAAPGSDILSSVNSSDNAYAVYNGTSMASPHVAGAAALIWTFFPDLTWDQVKTVILAGAEPNPALTGLVATDGELDLVRALSPAPSVSPDEPFGAGGEPGVTPYLPSNKVYVVSNPSPASNSEWNVTATVPWLTITPASFAVPPLSSTNVVVAIDQTAATALAEGVYFESVDFTDITHTGEYDTARGVIFRVDQNYKFRSIPFDWRDPAVNHHQQLYFQDGLAEVALPFTLHFYESAYSNIVVSERGLIGVSETALRASKNADLPAVTLPNAIICPYWDNLNSTRTPARCFVGREGFPLVSNRDIVVTWVNATHNEDLSQRFSFQVIIPEGDTNGADNDIIFQYQNVQQDDTDLGGGRSATVGVEGEYGALATSYGVNGSRLLVDRQALLFSKNPPVDVTPPTGMLSVDHSTASTVTYEVRFDEVVNGLDPSDFTLGGNAPGRTIGPIDGSGMRYFVSVTGITDLGTVELGVMQNAVWDLSGNSNDAFGPLAYAMPYEDTAFEDRMENGPGDWVPSMYQYATYTMRAWEWGVPSYASGPPAAASGSNCWGTVLTGDYPDLLNGSLESPVVVVGENPVVHFSLWLDLEQALDLGYVEANAGHGWVDITPGDGALTGSTGGWVPVTIPLDNGTFGNRPIRVRFRLITDFSLHAAGMYVDDFRVVSRRPPGVWAISFAPTNAPAGSTSTVTFTAYNGTTQSFVGVTARIGSPNNGVTIDGTDLVSYGNMGAGEKAAGANGIDLALGGAGEFQSPSVQLFHSVTSTVGFISQQEIPFEVTGLGPRPGSNVVTVSSLFGVRDWLGRFLPGDGAEGSSLFQLLCAGDDESIDPPALTGAATGDDALLYSTRDLKAFGRFGEGKAIPPNLGQFKKSFLHDLPAGKQLYVRAWDGPSFNGSVAYGDSPLYELSALSTQRHDFERWTVDTALDPDGDFNLDSIPDGFSIEEGLAARTPIGPLANTWTLDSWAGGFGEAPENMSFPGRVVVSSNHVFVADTVNNRVQVWARDLSGWPDVVGSMGADVDEFNRPQGLALDPQSNRLVVADTSNHRISVWSLDPVSGALSPQFTFGSQGSAAGEFDEPYAVGVGTTGRIYVADTMNHRIQVFEPDGTYATTFGSYGTGAGQLNQARGICVDDAEQIYVADTLNHRVQVFQADGTFVTMFGSFGDGDGEFNRPADIQKGVGGRLYVADTVNHRVQVFDAAYAHLGTFKPPSGKLGSGPGELRLPQGSFPAPDDYVTYVADTWNHRVQKLRTIIDIDNDGMDDVWEDLNGLNSSVDDARGDLDGDNLLNIGEFRLGYNPNEVNTNANWVAGAGIFSILAVDVEEAPGGVSILTETSGQEVTLRWQAWRGNKYVIQHTHDLANGPWVSEAPISAVEDGVMTWTALMPTNSAYFYRVQRVAP